ncbi:hypothetical protein HANVADRAFT_247 [Hanseniaspora valbyensis NRRL Y-1626]|uniref:SET domain-containing protein n=1 Tax=Hanseniaspora valbyensis NRRL Y-1626 TaxID=766949 RepID=A0A1B7TKE5_9ASCO|nr:hypothetical protein HANVADRAFT_247 [Hanseniaspora valbyensis NRRL Y-1626]
MSINTNDSGGTNPGKRRENKQLTSYPFVITPGPAVAILSEPYYRTPVQKTTTSFKQNSFEKNLRINTNSRKSSLSMSENINITNNNSNSSSDDVKGLVAAAALATSQQIPLPLRVSHDQIKKEEEKDGKNEKLHVETSNIAKSNSEDKMEVENEQTVEEDDDEEEEEDFDLSDYVVGSNDNVVSCICGNNNLEEDADDDDDEEEEEKEETANRKGDVTSQEKELENNKVKNSPLKNEINIKHDNEKVDETKEQFEVEEVDDEEEDDNSSNGVFWLQCDHCNRWVHGKCYGHKDNSTVNNSNFHCHICRPEDHPLAIKKFKKVLAKKNAKTNKKRKSERQNKKPRDSQKKNRDFKKINGDDKNNNNSNKSTNTDTVPEAEPIVDDTIKRVRLKNIKDLYGNIYYPIEKNEFAEPYIEKFLSISHKRDSGKPWVADEIDIKTLPAKSGDKFNGIPSLFVISKEYHSNGDLIHKILGKVGDQKNYINDPKNQYRLLGVSKPKVIFHSKWPIYIDMRLVGNDIRYVRRSCHPNCEIATVVKEGKDTTPQFYLRALKDISVNEELTVGWQWDINHPMWKITPGEHQLKYDKSALKKMFEEDVNNANLQFNQLLPLELDDISEPERYFLIYCVDTLLTMVECACPNHKRCQLRTVKKYYNLLLKLKKSMSLSAMRYKTYDLLNQHKLKEPKQSSILNDLKSKEENRYVNRFDDYKSFLDRKRKLEEESTYDKNSISEFSDIKEEPQAPKTSQSFLPSPLSPKQYKLELIAQYKLQNALQNNPNIKYKKQKTLESTIPKIFDLFQKNQNTTTANLLIKNEKLSNKKDKKEPEINYQELLLQKLMKGEDIASLIENHLNKNSETGKLYEKHNNSNNNMNTTASSSSSSSSSSLQNKNDNENKSSSSIVGDFANQSKSTNKNNMDNNDSSLNNSFNSINNNNTNNTTNTKKKMSFADYRKKSKPN